MRFIEQLDQISAGDRPLVGGKAVGLGKMISAGVPVPPGFTLTTSAYLDFISTNGLDPIIDELLKGLDYALPENVEFVSSRIHKLIIDSKMPDTVRTEVEKAYQTIGIGVHVAVRSSGIAEDMGDASFAGLYDSFLDIRGTEEVILAIQKCWASLWTARCLSYRNRLSIAHRDSLVAVIVQEMVAAEVAGVLFTANPLNERSDEIVINATWGLGESIASGIVTPDELILDHQTLKVKRLVVGSKELKIFRNPDGPGTKKTETSNRERESRSLTDSQAARLAAYGQRALEIAGGIPQDIEWAFRDDLFFILQSRDVTGAEFQWSEDLEVGNLGISSDETTWSNIWAQEYWTGAVTPLFYSIRGEELSWSDYHLFKLWGFKSLVSERRFKFHRSTVYFNSDADQIYYRNVLPKGLRSQRLTNLPPEWRETAGSAPWNLLAAIRMHLRIRLLTKDCGPFRQTSAVYKFIEDNTRKDQWPDAKDLENYTDEELISELDHKMQMFEDYLTVLRPCFHVYSPYAFAILRYILDNWYKGGNEYAFADLVTGLPRRTEMLIEQVDLWEVGEIIRKSPSLTALLHANEGFSFFQACKNSEEGESFLKIYEKFVEKHGHRGHQDRDLWNPRRSEDPMLDYRSFVSLVKSSGTSPVSMEEELIHKRLTATEEVFSVLRRKSFGSLKVKFTQFILDYIYTFLLLRDDERPFADRVTMAKKRATTELGRRLFVRKHIENSDDFYFLGFTEINEVLRGKDMKLLTKLKIKNRRKMFDRFVAREEIPADYLRAGLPLQIEDLTATDTEGVFQGTGTSRGLVTATARVVPDLQQIGRLQKGEVLICNSTDPGWASAFGLISGLVIEAGGMLSHGACLSREYGLPAVTLSGAMRKIPDGAQVTVNGETGRVTIVQ
ncbi:phosphoenolpyruvate synthase [Candidatus Planktophila versatilis]|uniref:PEP/pyruvate-binding domain-containing protein n=1 Tax=Candidatus Planktophila versatilis TaxID=1884905 RepID=UPI003BEF076F